MMGYLMQSQLKEDLPKVLVITIVKNDLEGLVATVKSVKAQNYPRILHFVIDGNSSKNLTQYLKSLDTKIEWISEIDNGIYDAMNKWTRKAKESDLVCWLNAGDLFESENTVDFVVSNFRANGWKWFYGNNSTFNSNGERHSSYSQVPFSNLLFRMGLRWIPHASVFMDTSFALSLGDYRKDIGLGSDQEFLIRAAKKSLPATTKTRISRMKEGGAHTTIKSFRREFEWQKFRQINEVLFCNSLILDTLLLPLLYVFHKLPKTIKLHFYPK